MPLPIALDAHDGLFASRMSAEEWQRIVDFRSRPRFLEGVRAFVGVARLLVTNNLILNKVALEAWRFQMVAVALYLHEARDVSDPRSGLTFANMAKACASIKLASNGRVFALLNLMKLGGYLKSERSSLDSRVVYLEPTSLFMAKVEDWTDGIFAAVDTVVPEGRLVERRAATFELGAQMRSSVAESLLDGWEPLASFPEVALFAGTDGGWLLIEAIVAEWLRHPDGLLHAEPVSINLRSFASDAGGSRSNLRRLLENAFEQGLLTAPPRGGANIILSPLMLCAFLTFVAHYLSYLQSHTPTN